MEHILKLEHISKSYPIDSTHVESVLDDVEMCINKGEFLIIKGPSGGGKTTIVNIMSGLDTDYFGSVYFNDKKLTGLSNYDLTNFRAKNIGFVFQTFNLIPHLSVIENVVLPMQLKDINDPKKLALNLLSKVDMAEYAYKNVTKLSGGQKQRVAIARALANDPDIIIADEPTGSLDSSSQNNIMNILKELNKVEGKTVILITHNDEIVPFGDRVVYVKDGRISLS